MIIISWQRVLNRTIFLLLIGSGVIHAAEAGDSIALPEKTGLSIYDGLTCAELYVEASRLEPRSQHIRSPLFNEQTDRFIFAAGTAYVPLFYYYGLSVPWQFKQEYRIVRASRVLDYVRRRMAGLRCFER